MKKVKVISVMLWVVLSLSAAAYVGCKTNNSAGEQTAPISDSTSVDSTVVDSIK